MPFQLELELKGARLTGHDHFWSLIRGLGRGGTFTVAEIVQGTNAHKATVDDFIRRLCRAGIIEKAGWCDVRNPHWTSGATRKARVYRVVKTPLQTPSLTRDGKPGSYGQKRQQMWNIIRGPQVRGGFTAQELVALAETDTVPISLASAKEYVQRLEHAGYLSVVETAAHHRLTRYRLIQSMNTGPKAPKLLRTLVMYDPNRRQVFGTAQAEEVA